jgi:hypothetical protein
MTPEQIRDYENPGIYKNVDRTPEAPAPVCTLAPDDDTSFQEGDARWTRHTVDIEQYDCACSGKQFGAHRIDCPVKNGRYTVPPPARSDGALWAWVAMGALVGLYMAWKHCPW